MLMRFQVVNGFPKKENGPNRIKPKYTHANNTNSIATIFYKNNVALNIALDRPMRTRMSGTGRVCGSSALHFRNSSAHKRLNTLQISNTLSTLIFVAITTLTLFICEGESNEDKRKKKHVAFIGESFFELKLKYSNVFFFFRFISSIYNS